MNEIERYLDRLSARLRGSGADVSRVLAETEEHLRDAVRDGVADGLTEEDAARRAVTRFGSPWAVARRFGGRPAWVRIAPELARLVPSAAAGLVAIGVSGVLAQVLGWLFGPAFVAGDLPWVRYTPQRCAELGHPAPGCLDAVVRDHFGEVVGGRVAAGVLGLLVLGGYALVRRRLGAARVTPMPGVLPVAGTALYGVATAVLLIDGMNLATAGGAHAGSGQCWSAGVVALVMFLAYARTLYREHFSRSTA
ncbi:permease prefix domain 1-containing protein [Actinoallomurus sp. CA-142502]|uniref:permease prefix domain 1-containing protein n=1 Tax=Actinoallomurus sp. CA-142502 TaxID=3239885 RepID=UPI003D8F65F5